MPTPIRALRIPDDIWHDAVAKAKAEGTSVTAVVVEALRQFLTK